MDNKLAELAEKIYQESIEKSRLDAEEIIQNARHEADNILREAKTIKMPCFIMQNRKQPAGRQELWLRSECLQIML